MTKPADAAVLADLVTPFAVRVAATLGVADALSGGPLPVTALARRCGADPEVLARLLHHLVLRGLFAEPDRDVFALNDAAATLKSGHPGALRDWLDLEGGLGRADLAFTSLLSTVRSGTNAYTATFGRTFAEDLGADDGFRHSFNTVMADKSREMAAQILARYDWRPVRHVADVGGGVGILLTELLLAEPHLKGTLIDLPETAADASRRIHDLRLDGRCGVHAGSFFDPLPVGADVFVIYDVLEDWDDEHAIRLLSRCADAAGPEGRVLIIEPFPIDDRYHRRFTDLDLRLLTYTNGRMRTEEETRAIARKAGLRVDRVIPASASHAIVECAIRGKESIS